MIILEMTSKNITMTVGTEAMSTEAIQAEGILP